MHIDAVRIALRLEVMAMMGPDNAGLLLIQTAKETERTLWLDVCVSRM